MTVIAFDGRTLAADKLMCNGMTGQRTTKIWRHGDVLIAITGNLSIGMEMRDWFINGAARDEYPASNRDPGNGASLIVISRDGKVSKYESGPVPFEVDARCCAFGSGDEAALVAMACGKTAAEAVELASRFNSSCGGGVDTLDLQP